MFQIRNSHSAINCNELPILFSLKQLAVGGDLEFQTELGVLEVLQFLVDGLQLGSHGGNVLQQTLVLI